MNRQDKLEIIKKWFIDNGLFFQINPRDDVAIEDYVFLLGSKIPDLYKYLRELDIVPKNSYQGLINLIEDQITLQSYKAIFK